MKTLFTIIVLTVVLNLVQCYIVRAIPGLFSAVVFAAVFQFFSAHLVRAVLDSDE